MDRHLAFERAHSSVDSLVATKVYHSVAQLVCSMAEPSDRMKVDSLVALTACQLASMKVHSKVVTRDRWMVVDLVDSSGRLKASL